MRTLLHECISILLACCLILQSTPGLSQEARNFLKEPPLFQEPPGGTSSGNQPVATREISKDTVISKFQELQQQSSVIQLLDQKLRTLDYSPASGNEHYWGETATYEKVISGRTEDVIGTIYIHDYVKPNSKDGVALGQATLTSSAGTTINYPFYLIAPEGDVTKAQEYTVVNNEVALQHSYWCCVVAQLATAGGTCAGAALTCSAAALAASAFSWAVYLTCIGAACGVAFTKAFLCCACNGSGWCEFIVGSCSQHTACPASGGGGSSGGGGGTAPPSGTCNGRCCETRNGKCTQCIKLTEQCP